MNHRLLDQTLNCSLLLGSDIILDMFDKNDKTVCIPSSTKIHCISRKLKMSPNKDFAFTNPGLTPDEELSRRGYSMYQASDDDIESGRGTERYGLR